MSKLKAIVVSLLLLVAGIVIGGYFFSESQPRSFLSLNRCQDCLSSKDLAGLLVSIGVNKLPGLIPAVEFETDKTIVIKNPFREAGFHAEMRGEATDDYLIIPKKDIRNIGEISNADAPYLIDAYLAARHIIEKNQASNYRMFTNGPGFQDVAYLHFHLLIKTFRD
jgi:Scavenger mRNA decapping enzyme C-term binding